MLVALDRPESIGVDDRGDDDRRGSQVGCVFCDGKVAADDDTRPADEVVGLAKALEKAAESAVGRAVVRDVSGIVQVKYQRLAQEPCQDVFEYWRAEQHCFALYEDDVGTRASTMSQQRRAWMRPGRPRFPRSDGAYRARRTAGAS